MREKNRKVYSLLTPPEQEGSAAKIQTAEELLTVLDTELRRLAEPPTTRLGPGQTAQPTALVHETYVRQVGNQDPGWAGRRNFSARPRAMRDILIEQARRKASLKHEGQARRAVLADIMAWTESPSADFPSRSSQPRAHRGIMIRRHATGFQADCGPTANGKGRAKPRSSVSAR
jgi:ECF sigma factor